MTHKRQDVAENLPKPATVVGAHPYRSGGQPEYRALELLHLIQHFAVARRGGMVGLVDDDKQAVGRLILNGPKGVKNSVQ